MSLFTEYHDLTTKLFVFDSLLYFTICDRYALESCWFQKWWFKQLACLLVWSLGFGGRMLFLSKFRWVLLLGLLFFSAQTLAAPIFVGIED